jgi:elongation factor G
MGKHASGDVRNLALIGGPRTGKTTLAEAILVHCGAIARRGAVAEGTTVSDYEPEEKEKQHSVQLGLLHATWKGRELNILDAPGYPDFIGEAAAALAACETAVMCVDAAKGLSFPGRKAWELAGQARRARCIVATHIDVATIDWPHWVATLSEALGCRCVAVVVPDGTGAAFKGCRLVPLAGAADGELGAARDALIEAAVEIDENALTRFLEQDQRPSEEDAARLVLRATVEGSLVPVLCVSATDGRGIEELLQYASRCLPSPLEGPFFRDETGEPVPPTAPGMSAFVFKTIIDPFVGRLAMLRMVTGQLDLNMSPLNPRTEKTEKVHHLQLTQGKEHAPVTSAVAGDIVAVTKLESLETSDTLCDAAHRRRFARLAVPKPMVARAIEPVNHADEVKLSTALKRAASEDPTFTCDRDESTGQLIAHGVSTMHLETVMRRIKERGHVEVKVSVPRVPLRETITASADGHYRHKKQTGGRGQFAEIYLKLSPAPRGSGLVFEDATVGGSVPRQFIPAVEKGARAAMSKGIIAGYPVVDVTVAVTDGKFHDVDSDEASFKIAGTRAFRDAFLKCRPVMLEPLLDLEIAIPARFLGAITSDLTGRRGHITGMDTLGDVQVVKARVPQREVLTYPTVLRSLTSGEGTYSSAFHDYEVVPGNVQQEIMAGFTLAEED